MDAGADGDGGAFRLAQPLSARTQTTPATCCLSRRAITPHYVFIDDALKVGRNGVALQSYGLLAIDIHRCHRRLAASRQADADIGLLGLLSPGPLTTQPITATFNSSTPG